MFHFNSSRRGELFYPLSVRIYNPNISPLESLGAHLSLVNGGGRGTVNKHLNLLCILFFFFLIDHQLPIKGYNLEQPDGREAKGKVWGKGTELLSLCIIIFLHLTGLLF